MTNQKCLTDIFHDEMIGRDKYITYYLPQFLSIRNNSDEMVSECQKFNAKFNIMTVKKKNIKMNIPHLTKYI